MQPLKHPRIPVHILALAAMLFWGGSFVGTTILLRYYQPITIIFIRLVISAGFLFSYLAVTGGIRSIRKQDIKWIVLSGFFNPFLYFLGENYGVMYTSSTVSAIIIATIPVFSPVVAWISFRERMTLLNLFGIMISFAGILVMILNKDLSLNADIRGILALFGAVVAALFYSVLLKKLSSGYSPVFLVASQNLIGIFLFLPLFLLWEFRSATMVPVNGEIILAFLALSLLASSLAFVFYAAAVKELGISKTNIFSNLIPVFTAFFSLFILSEEFTFQKIAGILIVITGVYLSERNKKR